MAYHYTKQIKDKLKSNIESIFTNFYVFIDYIDVVDKNTCILIQEEDEDVQYNSLGYPRIQERILNVGVLIYIKSDDKLKEKISNYKYLMERALFSSSERVKLNNLVDHVDISSVQQDRVDEKEKNIMAIYYSLKIYYQLDEQNPDQQLI